VSFADWRLLMIFEVQAPFGFVYPITMSGIIIYRLIMMIPTASGMTQAPTQTQDTQSHNFCSNEIYALLFRTDIIHSGDWRTNRIEK